LKEPDPELIRLRSDYRRLNESFERSFAFRFGRGVGFSAEMLGVVKCMMSCLKGRTRLCMSQGGRPAGVGIVNGITDYFEPVFPVVDAGRWNALNIATIRGSGRLPFVRRGVSRLLRAATGADHFMMDDLGALPARLVVPELGIDVDYWDACALLVRLVWDYRPEVKEEVARVLSGCDVPHSYVSVHVRRGDKSVESPYVPLDRYATAIESARPEGCAIAVASDDARAASELARLLPSRFPVVVCSVANSRGYIQGEFNRLPAADRFRQVNRFLAELELLRGGDLFVGSAGSNVTYLIEMMRAGRGVLQVC